MDSPRHMLSSRGLRPKDSFGQNFLGNEVLLQQMVALAGLTPGEVVVELGAGLGHLSRHLLEAGVELWAVEKDRDMAKVLREHAWPRFHVVEQNAVKTEFESLTSQPEGSVVGNLPYHLSAPLLFSVLRQARFVRCALFCLQREVVERLVAPPGNRNYGLLSVLLGHKFALEKLLSIPAACFFPAPKVDSAVLRMRRLPTPRGQVKDEARFMRLVKAAFSRRRKTLANALKSDMALFAQQSIQQSLEVAQLDGSRRPETLSAEEFARLEAALP
ncbi:MAG: 16S rRNA (adenine(1518)-N(6)/adenine(1519)-N(6))-dimethyltransferase RsmA [Proteobacteria bacterium]|nr:16S rRNA (adenine(1518)-N(6)/adenine(1519)-N(6))-dimethyltransferase RsmA [Cystobacterineae bacterium]MCL2259164.1 16S rRNA (adenine(1518)-N(6)/adenine(1519)-N(6))-dimethyltransferase RsmA [Cystobacterineae bacterium]MCL2314293.1 16S rRNA (adenine(1518)-N(6)/adenine(1519)-N(6))-dimethyltransferase RsmA [Pseudomonadota bacterium]